MERYTPEVDESDVYQSFIGMVVDPQGGWVAYADVTSELTHLRRIKQAAREAMRVYEQTYGKQYKGVLIYEDGFKELKTALEATT